MTVRNQTPLVMQKLCRREALSNYLTVNISNYSNSKKKKRQHKKRKINNSRAGEILTEKHNESHEIHKRKQILQQTQTHQSENQNYRQISATIKKTTQVNRNLIKFIM